MFSVAHELKASYAFVERNFFLTRRYWGWEIAFLVYSVAGALSISLIGADQGSPRLILLLMVGAIFWNYLSVVFSWIAETISVERWEGTLEYTMMAPIRRSSQLFGSVLYAMIYGLIHTAVILVVLLLFFPQLDFAGANLATVGAVHAARLVQLRRDRDDRGDPAAAVRGARGADDVRPPVRASCSCRGVYYSVDVLPGWMQVLSRLSPATYVLDGVRHGPDRRRPGHGARSTTSGR